MAPEDVLAVSAASGRGVTELVRRVRAVLDALPKEAWEAEAEGEGEGAEGGARRRRRAAAAVAGAGAVAQQPGRRDTDARIGEFEIEADLSGEGVAAGERRGEGRGGEDGCIW